MKENEPCCHTVTTRVNLGQRWAKKAGHKSMCCMTPFIWSSKKKKKGNLRYDDRVRQWLPLGSEELTRKVLVTLASGHLSPLPRDTSANTKSAQTTVLQSLLGWGAPACLVPPLCPQSTFTLTDVWQPAGDCILVIHASPPTTKWGWGSYPEAWHKTCWICCINR